MFSTVKFVLKSILKIVLWMTGIVFLMLFLLVLLIRVPAIQNKIMGGITNFVNKKTGAGITYKEITIASPNSISIQGLLVSDLKKDTLLYAQEIKASFELGALIKKTIHIQSVNIHSLTANLYRDNGDSLYNFNFILKAFQSSGPKKKHQT